MIDEKTAEPEQTGHQIAPVVHTPGPWTVEDIFEDGGLDIIIGYQIPDAGSPIPVAHICGVDEHGGPPKTKKEVAANARLIAAAPELLAACQQALLVVDEAYEATGFIRIAKTSLQRMSIEAAIAKAMRAVV